MTDMDIILIKHGKPAIVAVDSVSLASLRGLIGAETLDTFLMASPIEGRDIIAYFDGAGATHHRAENVFVPSRGAVIRGPLVLLGIDENDRESGLLPEEMDAYDLYDVPEASPFPALLPRIQEEEG